MGIGIDPSKTFNPAASVGFVVPSISGIVVVVRCRGMTTPHSQFRQFSLGFFSLRSMTSLPHALSEQLAEPM